MIKKSFLAVFITLVCAAASASTTHAASFNPGRIIDDTVFTNNTSMSVAQIQAFLNSKVSSCDTNGTKPASDFGRSDLTHAQYAATRGWNAPPYTCLRDYAEAGKSSAQIIFDISQQYTINPQVLIVLLQKEAGLVTDTWPLASQYRTAGGYGCPDSTPGACDSAYYGFTNQMTWAARLFRSVLNQSPTWYSPYVKGWNYIQWSPVADCGGSMVYIQNWSTAALYDYTPYQPNQSALNAGYGTGDSCSAYGNRNFFLYFTDWFGPTTGNLVRAAGGGVYLIENGTKRAFPNEETFLSNNYRWSDVVTASATELALIPNGSAMTYNTHFRDGKLVTTSSQGAYLIENGFKRVLPSAEAFVSWSYKWSELFTISTTELSLIPDGPVLNYNTHFRDGRLVMTPSQGVYLVENGLKRPFPSAEAFTSGGYSWSSLLSVSLNELSLIPDGSAMTYNTHFRDGKLVTTSSQGAYLIENGFKRVLPSAEAFVSWSYKWSELFTISTTELSLIPDGPVLNYNTHFRDGRLVMTPSQGVYLVENGLKRPFPSAEAFTSLGYKWSGVITISSSEMNLIPTSTPMS